MAPSARVLPAEGCPDVRGARTAFPIRPGGAREEELPFPACLGRALVRGGIPQVAPSCLSLRWRRRRRRPEEARLERLLLAGRPSPDGLAGELTDGPACLPVGKPMACLPGPPASPSGPKEPKRGEAGAEEWCDSGLGSLSEAQLGQLQEEGGLGPVAGGSGPWEMEGPAALALALAVTSDPGSSPWSGPQKALPGEGDEEELERLDSALGDSLGGDEDVGRLVAGVGAVRLEKEPVAAATAAVAPEAWLHHVLGFVTEDGDTALHLAVIHEHEAFLESILQYTQGTDYLDIQNDLGQTALHIAVILGAPHFVSKLVSAGAGLCVQEKGGHTALHLACREGQRECAQQLLAPALAQRPCEGSGSKAQLDFTNYDGFTPLHVAVLRKDVEMVGLLISAGSDLNKPELSCGRSPLHLAVESQCPEVVEQLLHAGADPEARMYVGYTPMYSAVHRPDQKIPQLLREFGSEEPDWDSDESLDSNSEEEYDDIVINCGH